MISAARADRVPFLPEVWFVPSTLADLECRHGKIGTCVDCDELNRQVDEQLELELEVTA